MNPTYAALTPLIAKRGREGFPNDSAETPPDPFRASLRRLAYRSRSPRAPTAREAQATGGFLFTHQGYSGPAVLDVSHVAVRSLARHDGAREDHRPMDAAA